jgi:hypothetical protein
MLGCFDEAPCSLLLAIFATFGNAICGRYLMYSMMVAIHNVCVERYGHCTVKQMYANVLNNIVKNNNK